MRQTFSCPKYYFFYKILQNSLQKPFYFFLNSIYKITKINIKSFKWPKFVKNYDKKILGTSDAWSTSRLSHQPSEPAYYIVDCRPLFFIIIKVMSLIEVVVVSPHSFRMGTLLSLEQHCWLCHGSHIHVDLALSKEVKETKLPKWTKKLPRWMEWTPAVGPWAILPTPSWSRKFDGLMQIKPENTDGWTFFLRGMGQAKG